MNNSQKAKKLYVACGTDPKVDSLMPTSYFLHKLTGYNINHALLVSSLVNCYASSEYEEDLIPITKETFFIGISDKEGWTNMKKAIYKLKKKKFIEIVEDGPKSYARIINDDLYQPEVYKREEVYQD